MRVLGCIVLVLSGFALGWLARDLSGLPGPDAPDPPASVVVPDEAAATDEQPPAAELQALLQARAWEDAVRFYASHADSGRRPELAADLRRQLLEEARQATGRTELEAAVELLQRFTWYYHRDQEALQLLSELAQRMGRPSVALDALLDALEAALSGPDPESARERVAELVDALAGGRLQIGDRSGAMALYEQVLARDPLNYRYHYLLARELLAAGEPLSARRQLEQIPDGGHDPRVVSRLRDRIAEAVTLAEQYGEGVPLERLGSHYLVQAETDDGRALRLLLDTGASRSVLKPAVIDQTARAERLPGTIRVGTANGVVTTARYRLPGLSLGPFRLDAPEVVMLELDGLEAADGLLGMDILEQFDYRIDPHNQRLLLTRRER